MTENKRFTLKESDIYNRNDVIHDNGIEMPQSTVCDLLNSLNEENVKLRARNKYLATKIQRERMSYQKQHEKWEKEIQKENEQLKQRNNRQAKQLDRLYNLIEEKDWRTLTDILDDFKRCEEQLQKEWGTYGDLE